MNFVEIYSFNIFYLLLAHYVFKNLIKNGLVTCLGY